VVDLLPVGRLSSSTCNLCCPYRRVDCRAGLEPNGGQDACARPRALAASAAVRLKCHILCPQMSHGAPGHQAPVHIGSSTQRARPCDTWAPQIQIAYWGLKNPHYRNVNEVQTVHKAMVLQAAALEREVWQSSGHICETFA
jgi:hypothetical protein